MRVICAAVSQLGALENTPGTVFGRRLRLTALAWRTQRPRTPHMERASSSRAAVAYEELYIAVRKIYVQVGSRLRENALQG